MWTACGTPTMTRSARNARDGGAPAALCRRLGFTDEVYWYSRYELIR